MTFAGSTPSASQSIHLRDVRKTFGSFVAVKSLTLNVEAGEFLTLLGPSGCGKTTTLRMVAGLMPQDGGEIRFGDRRVDFLPANKRNVGLVFQNYALFPHMTVAENVGFGLRMRGWSKARAAAEVEKYLALVRLEAFADRRPSQLSGGQQQRVAVARALAFQPELVLLDEPLSNLDAKLREEVRLDLRSIQRSARQTTIFVTHDQVEALAMSDRVVLMNHGDIEQMGAPDELYDRPASEFAARFIGANNLIPAQLAALDPSPVAIAQGLGAGLEAGSHAPGVTHKGQDVWICIRPEHITVDTGGDTEAVNRVRARLIDTVFQGTTTLLETEVPGIGHIRAECAPASVSHLRPGQEIVLNLGHAHLVPRDTASA